MTRQRVCSEPEDCEWAETETDACSVPCMGKWSDWGEMSECSVTCGTGTKSQSRTCEPEGSECDGDATESFDCVLDECLTYLDWTEWSGMYYGCHQAKLTAEPIKPYFETFFPTPLNVTLNAP